MSRDPGRKQGETSKPSSLLRMHVGMRGGSVHEVSGGAGELELDEPAVALGVPGG